jgi:uncharacterized membrane protein YraQ (UPF0718 family)
LKKVKISGRLLRPRNDFLNIFQFDTAKKAKKVFHFMTMDSILNLISQFAISFWATLAEMSPYLLFGFLMAGLLSVLIPQASVERHLGGSGLWPVVKASLFGVPLPLCSCSVIPVSMSLHKHGASKASTVSFLLSTPQTGVDSILVTYSLLGIIFAIFRPIAAFITGVAGGVFVRLFGGKTSSSSGAAVKCTDECCWPGKKSNWIIRVLRYGFVRMPSDIGKPMLIGIFIAAGISALIPADFFAHYLPGGIISMLVMMMVGIPIYVCATASVPIAAALIAKGLSAGAALVFLMTGPATNAASFLVIWQTLGRRTAIIYLATVAGCAVAFGLIIDYIFTFTGPAEIMNHIHNAPAGLFKNASAIILLAILAYAIINKSIQHHKTE